ncbi:MAG: site-specific integrase [Atopobiaceae bacterium]|nr:site-specific integrase [Atopobiaceae bacterium]
MGRKYSNPALRERGDGRWQARFYYKEGDNWKELSRSFKATSKRAARKRAAEIAEELEEEARRAELGGVIELDEDEMLVENFLERFISNLEGSGQIEHTTAAGYRASAQHACRYLLGTRMDEITAEMILDMQDGLLNVDGLCADSVAKDHRLLKQAMSYAVEIGAVARSPFTKSVRAPKRRRREPNALDDAGRRRLLGALDDMADTELTLAVRLALSCGMRREEVCGLRWRDVDLENDLVMVRNAIAEANGKTYEKAPKSETSRRDIPLEPDLKRRLAERLARVAMAAGDTGTAGLFVIGNTNGRWCTPSTVGKEFTSLAKQLDLVGTQGRRVTFHDLRHTYATYLIARGVDVKTVASLMGHADATVTLNVYASADPTARRQAAEVVARAMSERDSTEAPDPVPPTPSASRGRTVARDGRPRLVLVS